jgi:hypothetical protein
MGASEGKPTEKKCLEDGKFIDFCLIIDRYLEKVKRHNKEVKQMSSNTTKK